MTEFDREYYEQGPMTGKSLYTNYRWLPELTLPLAHHIAVDCNLDKHQTVCDFGCAAGEFLYYLKKKQPNNTFFGTDIRYDLIHKALEKRIKLVHF